jgi:hypothetical protein
MRAHSVSEENNMYGKLLGPSGGRRRNGAPGAGACGGGCRHRLPLGRPAIARPRQVGWWVSAVRGGAALTRTIPSRASSRRPRLKPPIPCAQGRAQLAQTRRAEWRQDDEGGAGELRGCQVRHRSDLQWARGRCAPLLDPGRHLADLSMRERVDAGGDPDDAPRAAQARARGLQVQNPAMRTTSSSAWTRCVSVFSHKRRNIYGTFCGVGTASRAARLADGRGNA